MTREGPKTPSFAMAEDEQSAEGGSYRWVVLYSKDAIALELNTLVIMSHSNFVSNVTHFYISVYTFLAAQTQSSLATSEKGSIL